MARADGRSNATVAWSTAGTGVVRSATTVGIEPRTATTVPSMWNTPLSNTPTFPAPSPTKARRRQSFDRTAGTVQARLSAYGPAQTVSGKLAPPSVDRRITAVVG